MKFEWDDAKNQINIMKHGMSFESASYVFMDPMRFEIFDDRFDEDRFVVIGRVGDVVYVVYTEREDAIRIISARKATIAERRMYYDRRI